jgi:hypothetical protein
LDAIGFAWEYTLHTACIKNYIGQNNVLYTLSKSSLLTLEQISLLTDIDFVCCVASPSSQSKLLTSTSFLGLHHDIFAVPVAAAKNDDSYNADITLPVCWSNDVKQHHSFLLRHPEADYQM